MLCIFSFIYYIVTPPYIYPESPPDWLSDKDFVFPARTYLSASGSGKSLKDARNDALSQIAVYFNSTVSVNKKTKSSIKENNSSIKKTRQTSSEISVLAESDLKLVLFTEAFLDEKNGDYFICAYINKKEACKVYSAELSAGISDAENILTQAKKHFSFSSRGRLLNALKKLENLESTVNKLRLLNSENAEVQTAKILNLKNASKTELEKSKSKMSFSFKIENDEEERISIVLQEILEEQGFTCSPNSPFLIKGYIKTTNAENSVGVFVKPRISLKVLDLKNGGNAIASYSKSYGKWGHANLEGALNKALFEVEKDLRLHFMEIFQ